MTHRITLSATFTLLALAFAASAHADESVRKSYCFFGAKTVDTNGTEERGWVCIEAFGRQQAADATTRTDAPVRTAQAESR
jgi:hypothetical protein